TTEGMSSGSLKNSTRTSSPSTTRNPSGTFVELRPPPDAILASPLTSPKFTEAKGMMAVAPARMGSPTNEFDFNWETSLSYSPSGFSTGTWARQGIPNSKSAADKHAYFDFTG